MALQRSRLMNTCEETLLLPVCVATYTCTALFPELAIACTTRVKLASVSPRRRPNVVIQSRIQLPCSYSPATRCQRLLRRSVGAILFSPSADHEACVSGISNPLELVAMALTPHCHSPQASGQGKRLYFCRVTVRGFLIAVVLITG